MLDVNTVRHIARSNDFEEIQYNEVSRVVSFFKESLRCRVNVYYSTGTVATCLDHPRSGKTQLFRRQQSLDDLYAIFNNPRQHTGVGYYRNKTNESWQPVPGNGSINNTFHRAECDDARRWRYIQSTQEGFCNEKQADQIAALCKLFYQLRFAPPNGQDIMTTAEKINAMPSEELDEMNRRFLQAGFSAISICADCEETGCKCNERSGSHCSISRIILKVAHVMDGVQGLVYLPKSGEEEEEKNFDIRSVEEFCSCQCHDGIIFRQRYSTFLEKLGRQFRSFPRSIRRELLHWFISKLYHGYEPFIYNPNYNPTKEGTGENMPIDFYGSRFCSNSIKNAHHDYGELTYVEGAKGCNCHGI